MQNTTPSPTAAIANALRPIRKSEAVGALRAVFTDLPDGTLRTIAADEPRQWWAALLAAVPGLDPLSRGCGLMPVQAVIRDEARRVLAGRASERRRSADGLCRCERGLLYDPTRYDVERVGGIRFVAIHRDAPALFTVTVAYGRVAFVDSNTGNTYRIDGDECPCEDAKSRAQEQRRPCKHFAALLAVRGFLARERDEEPQAA
jgi:hypothetical protein